MVHCNNMDELFLSVCFPGPPTVLVQCSWSHMNIVAGRYRYMQDLLLLAANQAPIPSLFIPSVLAGWQRWVCTHKYRRWSAHDQHKYSPLVPDTIIIRILTFCFRRCPMFMFMFDVHNLKHFNLFFLWYYLLASWAVSLPHILCKIL